MLSLLARCLAVFLHGRRHRPFSETRAGESLLELKALCLELIEDVGASQRLRMGHAIREARHLQDVWNMRSALFGSIALSFGEREARARLARLDVLLG